MIISSPPPSSRMIAACEGSDSKGRLCIKEIICAPHCVAFFLIYTSVVFIGYIDFLRPLCRWSKRTLRKPRETDVPTPKPLLKDFLSQEIRKRYATLKVAAAKAGMTHDRLRRALSSNKYSKQDLELIAAILAIDVNTLRKDYEFSESKKYSAAMDEPPRKVDAALNCLDPLFEDYDGLKRLARKFGQLTPVVNNLYAGWDPRVTMVLFLHPSSYPVEWDPTEKEMHRSLVDAARKGAHVFYILESSDEYSGVPKTEKDATDDAFEIFAAVLSRDHGTIKPDEFAGLIAMIRLPHCPFCVPFQKPTLCFWPGHSDDKQIEDLGKSVAKLNSVAITTAMIPERTGDSDLAGVLLIPQHKEFAIAMMRFLNVICTKATLPNKQLEGFRAASFPELTQAEIMARLLRLL